ncbi:chorismate mutase [Aquimarina rhabdastrellae]
MNQKEASDCNNMNEIRHEIDLIDHEIVQLIAKRALYVYKAAEFKKDETAVRDQKRVKAVIESKKQLAKLYKLSPTLIENIYTVMIQHFINEEISLVNN